MSNETLSELSARPGAEVIEHVDVWWSVWAKYDPRAVRNGVHIERDCTIVRLPSWTYVVTGSEVLKKKPESVQWQPTGGDLSKQEQQDPYGLPQKSREQITAAEERRSRRAADDARRRAAQDQRMADEVARRRAARKADQQEH